MKCLKCGSEWKVNKVLEQSIELCPFCQAQLKPKEKTVYDVIKWLVDNKGTEVFLHGNTINAYLADLVVHEDKSRRRIKLALSSGAGEMFYNLLLQSKGQLSDMEINKFKVSIEDLGFTEEFTSYILSVFLYSVSFSLQDANNDARFEQSSKDTCNERNKFLKEFCLLIELVRKQKEKREYFEEHKKSTTNGSEYRDKVQKYKTQEELKIRIGERISEGLSKEQLAEFDACKTQTEAAEWLRKNRPDYRIIVEDEHERLYGIKLKNKYYANDIISFPLFNSVINHPKYGDEREFIHIRLLGEEQWTRSLVLKSGNKYEVDVFIRNDANPSFNTKQYNNKGVALNSRVSVDFPSDIINNMTGKIAVSIMCNNEKKKCVDEVMIKIPHNQNFRLHIIDGSPKIINNWKANNSLLSSSLFSKEGTLIGLNGLNGVIPGGDEYIIHVRFTFEAQTLEDNNTVIYTPDWSSNGSLFKSWFKKK